MYDDFLYKQLQNTLIIPDKIKQEVLLHFEKLTEKQIQIISQLLNSENNILLNFLKEQKNNESIPITELKNEYIKYREQERQVLENKEKYKEKQELEYLLDTL